MMHFVRKGNSHALEERDLPIGENAGTEAVLPVLVFPGLECVDGFRHFFTTREGGVSEGFLSSLNLGTTRGDKPLLVSENYRRVARAMGTVPGQMVLGHQIHGTNVVRVNAADAGAGVTRPMEWESADGLVTDVPGMVLGILVADCVPVLFEDPVHHAVGACHSGWRGTVGRICAETVRKMREEFGTDPADLLVGIGPSICQDHYEVSSDVEECFRKAFPEDIDRIADYRGNPGHVNLDLGEACRITLLEAGVQEKKIFLTDICTACNPELLFSHRASSGRRGNLGAFIMMT